MTPDEAAKRFELLRRMAERELPAFIQQRVAFNAVEDIRERVTLRGQNFRGGQFKPYSRKPILTSGTTEKSKNIWRKYADSPEKRKQLKWVTIKRGGKNIRLFELKGGYAQMRRDEDLQTGHKDFEFTTQMWRNFGVKRTSKTNSEFVVTIGGKNVESQKKINANSKREGINIINLSDKELKDLAVMVDKELQRYINKLGLS